MAHSTDIGNSAEAFVSGRLERRGYRVVERNWRTRGGEIDIVALDGDTLVFVEVKVRSGLGVNLAEDAVDARKLTRLLLAADRYVESNPEHHDRIWRVDFVAVTLSRDGVVQRYNHFENLTIE